MNWLLIALIHLVFIFGILLFFGAKRKFTWASLLVALAHIPFILVNLVAPFRGILDPNYNGYSFGLLRIEAGIGVTIVASSILLAALISACFALLNVEDKRLYFILVVDIVFAILFSIPGLVGIISNLENAKINLGEYLRISGAIVGVIYSIFFIIPVVFSLVWVIKKLKTTQPDMAN